MKTLTLKKPGQFAFPSWVFELKRTGIYLFFGLLLLLWTVGTTSLENDPMAAAMDTRNLYLLITLSLMCFLALLSLCWWLLHVFWSRLKLPRISSLIIHFKSLPSWLQLGFVWASFALLLSAAIGCLIAIC